MCLQTWAHQRYIQADGVKWIRQLIKQAYSEVQDEDIPHLTHTNFQARELRAFASSLAFHQNYSLKQVMTSWRNNNAFVSFYLRDHSQMGDVTTTGLSWLVSRSYPEDHATEIRVTFRCWLLSHSFHCPEPGDTVMNGTHLSPRRDSADGIEDHTLHSE